MRVYVCVVLERDNGGVLFIVRTCVIGSVVGCASRVVGRRYNANSANDNV